MGVRTRLPRSGQKRRGSWWHDRLRPWLRLPLIAVAVWGLVLCALWVRESYDDAVAYRRSPLCAADVSTDGCVGRERGRILDRRTGENCTTDSNGVQTCTRYYEVRLRRPSRTYWLDVGPDTYKEVQRGDRAELRTWHGAVVRMVVAGHTENYAPPSEDSMTWRLALMWIVLGAALWITVSGRLVSLLSFPNFGWLWLALPFSWMTHGVLLGTGVVEWIVSAAMTAFGVAWMVLTSRV